MLGDKNTIIQWSQQNMKFCITVGRVIEKTADYCTIKNCNKRKCKIYNNKKLKSSDRALEELMQNYRICQKQNRIILADN